MVSVSPIGFRNHLPSKKYEPKNIYSFKHKSDSV